MEETGGQDSFDPWLPLGQYLLQEWGHLEAQALTTQGRVQTLCQKASCEGSETHVFPLQAFAAFSECGLSTFKWALGLGPGEQETGNDFWPV